MSGSEYKHRLYDSVYVTADGKVGIGTSDVRDSLQVQGTATVQELSAHVITSSNQTLQLEMPYSRIIIR